MLGRFGEMLVTGQCQKAVKIAQTEHVFSLFYQRIASTGRDRAKCRRSATRSLCDLQTEIPKFRPMKTLALALALAFSTPAYAEGTPGDVCHLDVPCQVGERSYHVKEPDDWDGVSPLPVLIHFHGWQRTGKLPVKHKRISGATRLRGVLLIAPNGNRKTWDFWHPETDDVSFAAEVLEDVKARYPAVSYTHLTLPTTSRV